MEKSLAIQLISGEHVGFILFAGGPSMGDCIFQLLPKSSGVFDDPAFKFLKDFGFRNAGEHQWDSGDNEIAVTLSTGQTAVIHLQQETLTFDSGPKYKVVRAA